MTREVLDERHGFVVVRRTWETTLHMADVDVSAFRHLEGELKNCGYAIVSLDDLVLRHGHEAKMADLLAEVYTATHSLNPPRRMGVEGWTDLLRRDPPVAEATALALKEKRYVAMSAAHRDEAGGLTLTWSGVSKAERQCERDLMLALTTRQILYSAGQGFQLLRGEFDSTNPWAMTQLGAFPFQPVPSWLTLQRNLVP